MKAAVIDRFAGPEEIYYTDIEKPVPGPDEVLVKNVYIGVGKPDYIMRSGICPFLEAKPPKLVVGNECAGIVEAVGADVFLESYDFTGKRIILFATSGGSGLGKTDEGVKKIVPGAKVENGRMLNGNVSEADVKAWVQSLNL